MHVRTEIRLKIFFFSHLYTTTLVFNRTISFVLHLFIHNALFNIHDASWYIETDILGPIHLIPMRILSTCN